ncbi:hypothetical protein F0562_021499 [Nyssa sinensis]|uniref:Uncharacterized protein n=1 Tax=Nyssa sinensis TaxID=561372 RepID=A0A5J5BJZ2_9ASTE|nr:hypothetical protein F0562_021499 [Nyssa sinensis]
MENEWSERKALNGEDDQPEEEKMEKFFALIRNFRDARNHRRSELNEMERKKNKIRKLQSGQSSWLPSFEWEDFTEEIEFRKLPLIFPAPCDKKEDKKEEDHNDEGGGRRKRAVSEDDEEEKINTFFTLIRNIRDAGGQIMFGSTELKAEGREKEMKMKSTWTPSFKLEDFAEEAHLLNNVVAMLPAPSKNEQHCNKEKQQQLDLNLSL